MVSIPYRLYIHNSLLTSLSFSQFLVWQVWTQEKSMPLSQVNDDNKPISSTYIQHDGVFYVASFEAQKHKHTCTNIIHQKKQHTSYILPTL